MLNIQRRTLPDSLTHLSEFDPIIQRIYAGRGVTNPEQIKRSAGQLLPVSSMKGIDDA